MSALYVFSGELRVAIGGGGFHGFIHLLSGYDDKEKLLIPSMFAEDTLVEEIAAKKQAIDNKYRFITSPHAVSSQT